MLLALLALLRLSVISHPIPVHGDELEFLAAIGFPEAYPVHQPGYPGWVVLGTLLSAIGIPPYAAYAAWSLSASLASPLLLYELLRRFVSPSVAWWAALGYGVNSLVWFHGVTALNYSLSSAMGLGIAGLVIRDANSQIRRIHACIAALVLSIGLLIRPDMLIWYAPLLLFSAWRVNFKTLVQAGAILASGLAAYFLFHAWTYGRIGSSTSNPTVGHTFDVIFRTSIFKLGLVDGLLRSGIKLAAILAWSMGLHTLLTPATIRCYWRATASNSHIRIAILLWFLPAALFMVLFHMSEAGPLLILAPIYVYIALGMSTWPSGRALGCFRAAVIFSIVQFTFYPWSADSTGFKRTFDAKIGYLSAQGLRNINRRDEIHTPGDTWPTATHQPTTAPSPGR